MFYKSSFFYDILFLCAFSLLLHNKLFQNLEI